MKSILNRDKYDYKSVKYDKLNNDFGHSGQWSDSDESTLDHNSSEKRNRFELKNRQNGQNGNGQPRGQTDLLEYINYEVKPDESLRAIALRYGCSVSTIKRINNLMSDHEFYGLRVIKLPVKKFGILSDVLVHQINCQSQVDDIRSSEREDNVSREGNGSLTVNIGISQHLSHNDSESASKFLSHMDEDLKKIRQSTKAVIESSNIDNLNQSLSNRHVIECDNSNTSQSLPQQKKSAFFSCDESDYGINWLNLLIIVFVLCFLVPIVYVIYISEHTHHNNTDTNLHVIETH